MYTREQELFLRYNPEIAQLYNNDTSLRYICMNKELQQVYIDDFNVPFLIPDNILYYTLDNWDIDNFIAIYLNMVKYRQLSYQINYAGCFIENDINRLQNICNMAFKLAQGRYIEYFSGLLGIEIGINYTIQGSKIVSINLKLTFKEIYTGSFLDTFKFIGLCNYIKMSLIHHGKITQYMNQYEVSRILYNWVVLHIRLPEKEISRNFTGYGALVDSYGVCQGFTAVYNCLCKLFGVSICSVIGKAKSQGSNYLENHIWSLIDFNGLYKYVDVTWGRPRVDEKFKEGVRKYGLSPNNICDFSWFAVDWDKIASTHVVDKDV